MAALAGLGVDNLLICIDGPEVPAMDGSAKPFVEMLESAGLIEQAATRRFIKVLKTVRVADGNRWISLSPADELSICFAIDFASPVVGLQNLEFQLNELEFRSEIAPARTFGFLEDVAAMQARGLALGGSLDNAVVVSGDIVMNEGGLRFADEFVRHKTLDALGDLYLAGAPILGSYKAKRAGHGLNNRLLKALFADADAWRIVTGRPRHQGGRARQAQGRRAGQQAALA
jgi:UDP-3-O-[3-hydroxymyristoyl] N-acetylglucosamine deacetylase